MLGSDESDDPSELLEAEIARLGARLRSMSLARLEAPMTSETTESRAQAAHRLACDLAGEARRLADLGRPTDRSGEAPPGPAADPPYLGPMYAGDQVVVLGRELLRTARAALDAGEDPVVVSESLARGVRRCRRLRLGL